MGSTRVTGDRMGKVDVPDKYEDRLIEVVRDHTIHSSALFGLGMKGPVRWRRPRLWASRRASRRSLFVMRIRADTTTVRTGALTICFSGGDRVCRIRPGQSVPYLLSCREARGVFVASGLDWSSKARRGG